MKFFFVIVVLMIAIMQASFSQRIMLHTSMFSDPKYSLGGSAFFKPVEKNMNELNELMKNCKECQDNLSSYKSKSRTSEVLGFIGGACIGWPLGGYIGGGEWQDYYTPMMLIGAGVTIIALIVASSAMSNLEYAVDKYNETITQNRINFDFKYNAGYSFQNSGKIVGISLSF